MDVVYMLVVEWDINRWLWFILVCKEVCNCKKNYENEINYFFMLGI